MKALSVREPWAFAITCGGKDIENRNWRPANLGLRFRGKFLIHASLKVDQEDEDDVLWDIAEQLGKGRDEIAQMYVGRRLGAIVGAATLVDVVYDSKSKWYMGGGLAGLVLKDAVECKPVPCKGMLGFFTPPADVIAQLHIPGYVENGVAI